MGKSARGMLPAARRRAFRRSVLAGALSLSWTGLTAQTADVAVGTPFSQEEYRALPRYCWASNTINKSLSEPLLSAAEREQWYERMGKEFMHVHHWCWALMEVRRGNQSVDPKVRAGHYRAAITDFNYVIRNCGSSFSLKPEFHLRKGMTHRLMDEDAAAAAEFALAIKAKPDYTPAYASLAELHLDLGNPGEAMKVLDAGLQHAPNSPILLQRRADLNKTPDVGGPKH